ARGPDGLRLAAAGGEDYELCFTAAPGAVERERGAFEAAFDTRLTRVGRTEEGEGAVVIDESGEVVELRAFQHWGEE
nr:thiamine-phosphate kinase [Gemmatimonadota bacterium]NIU22293.1 thiamine-phosphate kinase [Actinomycetota bacterium]NIV58859.1 thiamine-phosphate kinase [Actinomycetota bacterium]NIW36915.1 thiamine-phosphate kinase [Gemmatimonadota bacterium]NIX48101.1 thiamine-phosphate kinase [Gemmatimonadota bacterium]